MPYITEEAVNRIEKGGQIRTPGELNYVLSTIVAHYVSQKDINYANLCEVAGVLRTMYREFERRLLDEYEKEKQKTGVDPYGGIL